MSLCELDGVEGKSEVMNIGVLVDLLELILFHIQGSIQRCICGFVYLK